MAQFDRGAEFKVHALLHCGQVQQQQSLAVDLLHKRKKEWTCGVKCRLFPYSPDNDSLHHLNQDETHPSTVQCVFKSGTGHYTTILSHVCLWDVLFTWSMKMRASGAQSVVLMKRTTSVTLHSNGLLSKHSFGGASVQGLCSTQTHTH